jgi:hypothetical protein
LLCDEPSEEVRLPMRKGTRKSGFKFPGVPNCRLAVVSGHSIEPATCNAMLKKIPLILPQLISPEFLR